MSMTHLCSRRQHQLLWTLVPFAIIAIYFAKVDYWDFAFTGNGATQLVTVDKTWCSLFQVVCTCSRSRIHRDG